MMKRICFTTILSKYHLYKAIAMFSSLKAHCGNFSLFVLCMDEVVYDILEKIGFDNIVLVKLVEIENAELSKIKADRSLMEYCWTLKPVFLYCILKKFDDAAYYAHLDADLFFFSDPRRIFEEAPKASLFITHHHNSEMFQSTYELTGKYNSGFVGCRNDPVALKAIKQWCKKCIEHCSGRYDLVNNTFGDQRYLEDWPGIYKNVRVIKSLGANAAMWNIQSYEVKQLDGKVLLNDDELIFYHFSGFTIFSGKEFNLCYYYHIEDKNVVDLIYLPYMISLSDAIREIKKFFPWFTEGFTERNPSLEAHYYVLGS